MSEALIKHLETADVKSAMYSYVIDHDNDPQLFEEYVSWLIETKELDWKIKDGLFQQLMHVIFANSVYNINSINVLMLRLLKAIVSECKAGMGLRLERIPQNKRNKGISVVLVDQFLSENHGPTKTTLDRAKVLAEKCGQKVIIINTAELCPPSLGLPFWNPKTGGYVREHLNMETVSWYGKTFDFFQCPNMMPDEDVIKMLIDSIAKIAPCNVVYVGGGSLVAGLINDMVPVITVGTIQSGVAITATDYQIIDKNMLEKGYDILERAGIPKEHIIPGVFTFSFLKQTEHVTRKELGIKDDVFALAMIGGRLDEELTDEFLDLLDETMTEGMQAAVIGKTLTFEEKIKKHPTLKGRLINLGFCSDVLSRVEHFDLYVNPTRRGGGTSCVEAMSKGLPVVTVNYGDVAGIVGEDFCCKDYSEMKELIIKYKTDKEFYSSQREKALKLAEMYTDSDTEFARIIEEYHKMMN